MASVIRICIVLVFCLSFNAAIACVCVSPEPQEMLEKSVMVFSGVVEFKEVHPWGSGNEIKAGQVEYTFSVGQVWKGPLLESVSVLDGTEGNDCAVRFRVGKHYLVYARLRDGQEECLWSNTCMRSRLLKNAVWDRAVLRDPFVVNGDLEVGRPEKSELIETSNDSNPFVASQAKRALEELRSDKGTSGEGDPR